jgi:hypothetical protein
MRVAIITSNLGGIDRRHEHVAQDLPPSVVLDRYYFDDTSTPPRPLALAPRMAAKAHKMLGWEYAPDADVIVWLDAAFRIRRADFVAWMLARLGSADACFMPHPERKTIADEVCYMADLMSADAAWLRDRYMGEPFVEQLACYLSDPDFDPASPLIAAGCFAHRPNVFVRNTFRAWLCECVRWSVQDQISLPYVLAKHRIVTAWLESGPWNCPYLQHMGHG